MDLAEEHLSHYRLYLYTNRAFIQYKFNEMFKVYLQEDTEPILKNVNRNKLEKLVREVLAFETNPELKHFYERLDQSINEFCEKDKGLDFDCIYEMMDYCLQKGLEVKEPEEQKETPEPIIEKKVEESAAKYPYALYKNEFNEQPPVPYEYNREVFLKQLKIYFDFMCLYQFNTGINTTFDRIRAEKEHMDAGKFLILCKNLQIPSEKLTRFVLMEKFKKIASGSKYLDYDGLITLLDKLNYIDPYLFKRMNVENRKVSMRKLKSVRTPFEIHDKHYFRELMKSPENRKKIESYEIPTRLLYLSTPRERYDEHNIKDEYKRSNLARSRLLSQYNKSHIQDNKSNIMQNKSHLMDDYKMNSKPTTVFTIDELKRAANDIDMKRLSRLIVHDDDDGDFMKSYHIYRHNSDRRSQDLVDSIRKRAGYVEKQEKSNNQKLQGLADSMIRNRVRGAAKIK